MDRTQTSGRMASERLRSFQHRRQCARMVHGLVLRRLLRHLPGEEPGGPRNRRTPRQPGWLLAAPNQGFPRCTPQQLAAPTCVYRLRRAANLHQPRRQYNATAMSEFRFNRVTGDWVIIAADMA